MTEAQTKKEVEWTKLVDEYLATLKWHEDTSASIKGLVEGNIRGFAHHLRTTLIEPLQLVIEMQQNEIDILRGESTISNRLFIDSKISEEGKIFKNCTFGGDIRGRFRHCDFIDCHFLHKVDDYVDVMLTECRFTPHMPRPVQWVKQL